MAQQGLVFNIQRFSTHDGPGIRTTVFLKGCPLTCLWCSNPESQSTAPQLMTRDIKCRGCGACAAACPEQAIRISEEQVREIDWHRCTHCFDCVDACIYGAMTAMGEQMTCAQVAEVVEKDSIFYKNSDGGVTVSGGEPLVQHAFLEELLHLLKQMGLHRTLDTTGHAPSPVVDRILPLVDLVLFDIKHLDTRRHKETTGVGNELILKNVKRVAGAVRTWIRIPLISGYNDGVGHITAVAEMAAGLGVEKVSFLPFHEGGTSKTSQIGPIPRGYQAEAPSDDHVAHLIKIMAKKNVPASVGS